MMGFVNVFKPEGESSSRTVQFVKRVLINKLGCDKKIKVGHFGTLDPDASGILPIAIGNACRLFDFSLDKRKVYIAEVCLGFTSDTLDIHGEFRDHVDCDVDEDSFKKVLNDFPSSYDQVPPNVSAKSIGGVRAYKLARQGVEFTLPPKRVDIFRLEFKEKKAKNLFSIEIECSSGTYIRSLCRDIGAFLGLPACMGSLLRTASGEFDSDTAVTKEQFESDPIACILPVEKVVGRIDRLCISDKDLEKLKNGVQVGVDSVDGVYRIYDGDDIVGLAEVRDKILRFTTRLR